MKTNNARKCISSSTDLYFDEHIGLQLAVELHDEMNINISTDKQILSIIFNSGTTWSTYIHTSMAL